MVFGSITTAMIRCSMTGLPMDPGDGIYDDGEWISWHYLNGQIAHQEAFDAAVKTPAKHDDIFRLSLTGRSRTNSQENPP